MRMPGRCVVDVRPRARAPARARVAAALAAAAAVVCALPGGAGAVSAIPQTGSGTIVVDGAVDAIVTVGSTTYLGGAFTHAGQYTGGFASVPVGGGSPTSLPTVNGTVDAVVSDGSGGWYVGGNFTSVGSTSISNLAHITSGGAVDASWAPSPNAQVDTLALEKGTLYVGGQFTTIGSTTRSYLAALTASTAAATNWDPEPDGEVKEIVLPSSGSTIYAAGSFAHVGSSARAGLASIDTSSGTASSWDPNPSPSGSVNALAVSPDGTTVYAGGTFTNIGGNALSRLAALSASTGSSNASWAPAPDSTVNALALSSDGGTIYVGGTFKLIGSAAQTRNEVAAVSTSTPGNPTAWDPSLVGSSVTAIALSSDGGTVYLGGSFTQVAGQSRQDLAAVATGSSASATSWQEDANAAPSTIAATSSAIGVGGTIASVGMSARSELAAVSSSGTLQDFNPGASGGTVNALAVSPDSATLYVGGAFTSIGGISRSRLAALTLSTGVTTSWAPTVAGPVNALAAATVGSDVDVYAGLASGNPRLQAFLASTGATPSSWAPAATNTGSVNALAVSSDHATLFVGGSYTTGIGTRIAALDSTTGAAAAGWPLGSLSLTAGTVTALAVSSDGTRLYLGGSFTNVGPHLVAVDTSGAVTWNGNVAGTTAVQVTAIALSGSTLYAGGTFVSTVGANAVTRTRLAAFDTTSANASSWNPAPDSTVSAITATSSGVLVGGSWANIGSTALPDFAVFTLSTPSVTAAPSIGGTLTPGSTLTCSTGTWSNSPVGYAYEWLRDGTTIAGATSATYVAGAADVGQALSCRVTATNGEGSASSTSSSVTVVSTPTTDTAPTVTGTVAVGTPLGCDPGTWTGSPTFTYLWLRDGKTISGATSASYAPVAGDVGHAVSCRVTGTNSAGSAIATSAAVVVPAATATSPPPTPGSGVGAAVGPSGGGTLSLPSSATLTWQPGAFAVGGTVVVSSLTLGADVNGFSRTSPVVSVAYTAPGASVPSPVFLQSAASVVFPPGVVPKAPYVATSEDGVAFTPIARLAQDGLPDGQLDGYFPRSDGSIVVYTRHTSLFALLSDVQAPTKPSTLVASLRGTVLGLRWAPAADNSRVIAYYEIVRGKAVVAKEPGSRAAAGFTIANLTRTSTFRVCAVDPAGNVGPLSPGITVVIAPRPKGVPAKIPRAEQQLRLWQSTPPSVRGPRPKVPGRLPKWYPLWRKWFATRRSLSP